MNVPFVLLLGDLQNLINTGVLIRSILNTGGRVTYVNVLLQEYKVSISNYLHMIENATWLEVVETGSVVQTRCIEPGLKNTLTIPISDLTEA